MRPDMERIMLDMQRDIDWYLDNANENSADNVLMFRRQIEKWKILLVHGGLAQIAIKLQGFPGDKRQQYINQGYGNRLAELCVSLGKKWIATYADIVATFGEEGIFALIEIIQTLGEHIAAVAAIMLSFPQFKHPYVEGNLTKAWSNARGTGLKLAIAYSLLSVGNTSPLANMAETYLLERGALDKIKRMVRAKSPSASPKELEWETYFYIAHEGQLVDMVLLDISKVMVRFQVKQSPSGFGHRRNREHVHP